VQYVIAVDYRCMTGVKIYVCEDFTVRNYSLCTTDLTFRANQIHCGFYHTYDEGRLHEHEVYQVHTIVCSQFTVADYFTIDCKNAKAFK
jgi:hypothetical protein